MSNTHEVAQRAAPGARVVYADNDPIVLRSKAEVARFFGRLDLVPPGITPLGQWAPGTALPGSAALPTYTALARKPG